MKSKRELLDELQLRMERDTSLPLSTKLIFGEGSMDARICFIGEAPGAEEEKQGRPFVGRSGQLLRKTIRDIGWREEDVYITNIVKRRPPENRDPTPEEIALYKPYLKEQLHILDPQVIVPLGRFAMNYFLPDAHISRDQGKTFLFHGKKIYPVFHPAAALRSTGMMTAFVYALTQLPRVIDAERKSHET